MNAKFVQCQAEACGWREAVNGRPGAEAACRIHRATGHRVFLYVQATEIRVLRRRLGAEAPPR